MALIQNTEHRAQALALLIQQFQESTNLRELLGSYVASVQDLEDTFIGLRDGRTLDNAVGDQLDGIGQIVGLDRAGLDDDDYRLALGAKVLVNESSGSPDELLEILSILAGEGVAVALEELFPASVLMDSEFSPIIDADLAISLLRLAKPAGVSLQYIFEPTATPFQMSSLSGTLETSAVNGMADAGQTTGGDMTGVLE